jgi:MGT family glycosyltransferase
MSKLIFLNVPGHGHVNPTLPAVTELVNRGFEVIYYNSLDFKTVIQKTGAQFRAYPEGGELTATNISRLAENLVNITILLLSESLRLLPFIIEELKREKPDVVIFDSICLWGQQAAHLLGIPHISSISTLIFEKVPGLLGWRDYLLAIRQAMPKMPKLIPLRKKLVHQYGPDIFPNKDIFPAVGEVNILYTSRLFQPETPFVDGRFHFVGPSIAPNTRQPRHFPFDLLTQSPLIYISLGTIHTITYDFLAKVKDAFASFPAQVVISTGEQSDLIQMSDLPHNFLVWPTVPQLDLLPKVDLFITHGGINSIQEGLYFGVPQIVIPQQMEQLLNGRLLQTHGAGLLIGSRPKPSFSAKTLRHTVSTVLNNQSYATSATKIGDSFREAGGYELAATIIEDKAKSGLTGALGN